MNNVINYSYANVFTKEGSAAMENTNSKILTYVVLCILIASMWGGGCFFTGKTSMKFEDIISPGTQPALEYDGSTGTPTIVASEGASWMDGKLYFTNINFNIEKYAGSGMWILEPGGRCKISKENVFLVGTTPLGNGNLAACYTTAEGNKFIGSIVEITPESEVVRIIANSCDGLPFGMPNDLCTDSRGGIYFTDPWGGDKRVLNKQGTAVYYVNAHGKVVRLIDWNEHKFPNGCVVSSDNKKFFLNDDTETVWVFDINKDGTLSNKRPFATLVIPKDSDPKLAGRFGICLADGMEIDRSGNLFVTSAVGIQVFDKTGNLLGIIEFQKRTTNLAFGGDDLSILYVTCHDRIYSIRTNTKGYKYPIR